ncbi:hypothetical protein BHE74_00010196 [Ensete ventricosum]|nr:hypothetical protein GW17_00001483 [Ensete ventricosum]RWW81433.1 hypothetical protein BHE74_00010196 [Ensete ventricosum]RZR81462.1 hypothetical protein BHM03_00007690 [Ensete ventricosum]
MISLILRLQWHTQEVSELMLLTCQKSLCAYFVCRNKHIKNMVTIDLHGQHVKQAIGLLKLHLLLFAYIPCKLPRLPSLMSSIIIQEMLVICVLGLVEKEDIKWREENAGTLILSLDEPKEYSFVESDTDSE